MKLRSLGLVALAACGNEARSVPPSPPPPSPPSSPPSPPALQWNDFQGIRYQAPAGTQAMSRDGTLPGPDGQGGTATGERPDVVLTLPGPHGFYVHIEKPAQPESLAGTKYVLDANKVGMSFVEKTTATGWELTYDALGDEPPRKSHIIYTDVAGGHYLCTYGADPDAAAAEAICRSIKAK